MSNKLKRYKKRKKLKNSFTVYESVNENLVDTFLNSSLDNTKVNSTFKYTSNFYDMEVNHSEVEEFLLNFKKQFNDKRFKQLIEDCKKEVINSIITPFGLGKIIAIYDKTGGNVDTIHNVRNTEKSGIMMSDEEKIQDGYGIYATEKEKEKYQNREKYNSNNYHSDKKYKEKNKEYSDGRKEGITYDYMTGEKITENEKYDLDHIISAKEIHDDPGRVLAECDGVELANEDSNLKPTKRKYNRSKKADSVDDFIKKKNERLKKIKELESKEKLTEDEKKELEKLKELEKIDDEKTKKADENARKKYNEKLNSKYYTSKKFIKNVTVTSIEEGIKMGLQQALGMIFVEFFAALFDEIIDIYKKGFAHGFKEETFFKILIERIKKIGIRLKDNWKKFINTFKDGVISGFISNLTTTLVNVFITTGRRLVRIIREGLFSLFRAIKIVLFPPENFSFSEALHEAKKIIMSGLIISFSVILEEYVDKLIKATAILEPFADIITSILIGGITGVTISVVIYYIDKRKNEKEMFQNLINDTENKYKKLDNILNFHN